MLCCCSCRTQIRLLVLVVLGSSSTALAERVIYVDARSPGGDGASWTTAIPDLQTALAAARSGDEVRVGAGLYRPAAAADPAVSFRLTDGVMLRGGYAGYGTNQPNDRNPSFYITTLSGDIGVAGVADDNSFQLIQIDICGAATVLDGFVVRDARGDLGGVNGGGARVRGGAPHITNCIFSDNVANGGGGVYVEAGSIAAFDNCEFNNNTSGARGGGFWSSAANPTLSNCRFRDNSADLAGGGVAASGGSVITLATCTFQNNWAQFFGGGVNVYTGSATVWACSFSGNLVLNTVPDGYDGGGGAYFENCTADLIASAVYSNSTTTGQGGGVLLRGATSRIYNCAIADNLASEQGGGMHIIGGNTRLMNCKVLLNNTVGRGAGINVVNGTVAVLSSTLCENRSFSWSGAGIHNAGGALSVSNSILWLNRNSGGLGEYAQLTSSPAPTVDHTCIQSLTHTLPGGGGNVADDPLFLNLAGADGVVGTIDDQIALAPNSPLIDQGLAAELPTDEFDLDSDNDRSEPVPVDLYWNARVANGAVDLGAAEHVDLPFLLGDAYCDGMINNSDVDAFVVALTSPSTYMELYPDCEIEACDVNSDLSIDNGDIDGFVAILTGAMRETIELKPDTDLPDFDALRSLSFSDSR